MDDIVDDRRAAFSNVPVRPPAANPAPTAASEPAVPALRGIGSPPPPKPAAAAPVETGDTFSAEPLEPTPVPPVVETGGDTARSREKQGGSARRPAAPTATSPAPAPPARIGTRRGNLVYIQTQVTPAVSQQLDRQADSENLVLGEVLMACARAYKPAAAGSQPRRRRRGNQVRRDIGVLPSEADEVLAASTAAGMTVSAFLRQALEAHLTA